MHLMNAIKTVNPPPAAGPAPPLRLGGSGRLWRVLCQLLPWLAGSCRPARSSEWNTRTCTARIARSSTACNVRTRTTWSRCRSSTSCWCLAACRLPGARPPAPPSTCRPE
uniref:Alternative protein n=1 Tax=Macrostomum lignano TaxID=282301 RepID=A0A1I8FAW3_9PLAT